MAVSKKARFSSSAAAMVGVTILLAHQACGPGGDLQDSGRAENAIVVVIDTLRADHLGCYGHRRPTSPFIDGLARDGVLFRRAQATAPWTVPSTATVLTGLYPSEHGAELAGEIRHLGTTPPQQLAESVRSLGQILQGADFTTGLFSANPYLIGRFKRGFEVAEVGRFKGGELTDKVLAFLASVGDRRFFLHLQYMDLHQPIEPPREFAELFPVPFPGPRGEEHKEWRFPDPSGLGTERFLEFRAHKMALYDGAIRHVDSEVERLIQGLEQLGLADSTLLVVTSDHGEEFWDHAEIEAELGGDPREYYGIGHGHSMFQEQLRVPLIFSGPHTASGRETNAPVSLVDLAPTLLELLAVESADRMSGRSLASYVTGKQTPASAREPLFSESPAYGPESWSLVQWPFKVIQRGDGSTLLFNLDEDPVETHDLSTVEPGRLTALLDELQSFRGRLKSSGPTGEVVMEEETEKQLQSLGYLE